MMKEVSNNMTQMTPRGTEKSNKVVVVVVEKTSFSQT
jgi:hypothetical protein